MGSAVGIVSCGSAEDITSSISKAVQLANFESRKPISSVMIKPNLCYYWKSATGCTTDPRIVAALVDWIRSEYGENLEIRVAEADASAMRTEHAFPMLGYEKMAREKGIKLFNLSTDRLRKMKTMVGPHVFTFEVPQSLIDVDLFVNVPKVKLMRATKITCAMKNIFGCIGSPRKIVYHNLLSEAIVGINKILRPHLVVVDGLVALGRFPAKLNLIMAGTDAFSVDWIAADIMGHNPKKIPFLKIAMKEGIGESKGILPKGESLGRFRDKFPREGLLFQKWVWDLQFRVLKAYKKLAGDIIPPFLEEI